jgi:3'-5' exoribonuclease
VHIEPASGEIDPLQFLPKTPLDVRTLFNRLAQIHRDIDNPYLRRLIKGFLGDEGFRRRFLLAPAARNHHHPYLGGLLEHVVSLSEACCRVADAYPALDRDMLIAGAFFHDIGKVEELTVTPRIEYSDRGRLVGHIVTGVLWIEEHARKIPGFPRATLDHLVHLVLSHHGTLEWGSPVRPLTKEAIALHALDNLDAQLWAFDRAVSEAKDNGTHWTEYQRMFGRQMFKGAEEPAPHGKPTPDTAGAAEASNTADQSTGARPRATRPTTARSS